MPVARLVVEAVTIFSSPLLTLSRHSLSKSRGASLPEQLGQEQVSLDIFTNRTFLFSFFCCELLGGSGKEKEKEGIGIEKDERSVVY